MATRAIIKLARREEGVTFSEHTDKIHTQIYHHYDGYPEYLGVTLANYLSDISVVNGLSGTFGVEEKNNVNKPEANGLGCLAAQLVCHLKLVNAGCDQNGKLNIPAGNVYLDAPGTKRGDLDYIYYVWATESKETWISIFERNHDYITCTFVGTPDKLIKKYDTN